MFVVDDVFFLPVFDPLEDMENHYFILCSGTDNSIQPAVDYHFFTDETGDGVDGFRLTRGAAENVHISAQEADSGPGGVDNGVLFSMHTAAEFVSLSVRYVEFVTEA